MAYRKLGRESRIRRSILAGITKDVLTHGYVVTTEARAKEARKFIDKMVTYGKKGTLVARRQALAFLHNDKEVVNKIFNDLAVRNANRNGGYTRILKVNERRGDNVLMVMLQLVEGPAETKKEEKKSTKKEDKKAEKKEAKKDEAKVEKKKATKKADKEEA